MMRYACGCPRSRDSAPAACLYFVLRLGFLPSSHSIVHGMIRWPFHASSRAASLESYTLTTHGARLLTHDRIHAFTLRFTAHRHAATRR